MSVDVPAAGRSLGKSGPTKRVNGFNRPSLVDSHVAQSQQNGRRELCSASRGEMASNSESTILERDKTQKAGATCLPQSDLARFSDRRTKPILKLMFIKLFPACSKNVVRVEHEIARMEKKTDRELIYDITKMVVHLVGKWNSIKSCLEDFRRNNWKLDVGNVHMEFSKVAYELFSNKKSWSHFTLFVGFAVSFAIYLLEHEVPVATSVVIEWTCQLVEEDLAKFFSSNGGWVGTPVICVTSVTGAVNVLVQFLEWLDIFLMIFHFNSWYLWFGCWCVR